MVGQLAQLLALALARLPLEEDFEGQGERADQRAQQAARSRLRLGMRSSAFDAGRPGDCGFHTNPYGKNGSRYPSEEAIQGEFSFALSARTNDRFSYNA